MRTRSMNKEVIPPSTVTEDQELEKEKCLKDPLALTDKTKTSDSLLRVKPEVDEEENLQSDPLALSPEEEYAFHSFRVKQEIGNVDNLSSDPLALTDEDGRCANVDLLKREIVHECNVTGDPLALNSKEIKEFNQSLLKQELENKNGCCKKSTRKENYSQKTELLDIKDGKGHPRANSDQNIEWELHSTLKLSRYENSIDDQNIVREENKYINNCFPKASFVGHPAQQSNKLFEHNSPNNKETPIDPQNDTTLSQHVHVEDSVMLINDTERVKNASLKSDRENDGILFSGGKLVNNGTHNYHTENNGSVPVVQENSCSEKIIAGHTVSQEVILPDNILPISQKNSCPKKIKARQTESEEAILPDDTLSIPQKNPCPKKIKARQIESEEAILPDDTLSIPQKNPCPKKIKAGQNILEEAILPDSVVSFAQKNSCLKEVVAGQAGSEEVILCDDTFSNVQKTSRQEEIEAKQNCPEMGQYIKSGLKNKSSDRSLHQPTLFSFFSSTMSPNSSLQKDINQESSFLKEDQNVSSEEKKKETTSKFKNDINLIDIINKIIEDNMYCLSSKSISPNNQLKSAHKDNKNKVGFRKHATILPRVSSNCNGRITRNSFTDISQCKPLVNDCRKLFERRIVPNIASHSVEKNPTIEIIEIKEDDTPQKIRNNKELGCDRVATNATQHSERIKNCKNTELKENDTSNNSYSCNLPLVSNANNDEQRVHIGMECNNSNNIESQGTSQCVTGCSKNQYNNDTLSSNKEMQPPTLTSDHHNENIVVTDVTSSKHIQYRNSVICFKVRGENTSAVINSPPVSSVMLIKQNNTHQTITHKINQMQQGSKSYNPVSEINHEDEDTGSKESEDILSESASEYVAKRYTCDICLKSYNCLAQLKDHSRRHLSKSPYKCKVCSRQLLTPNGFHRHMLIHEGNLKFKCDVCDKRFVDKWALQSHSLIHTDDKPYKCDLCPKKFKCRASLTAHGRSHSDSRPFECNVCSKSFKDKDTLKRHVLNHETDKPYKCHICSKSYVEVYILRMHMLSHTDDRKFRCDLCEKTFKTELVLRRHLWFHKNEKQFMCEICSIMCRTKGHLQRHLRVHSGEKPFQCEICGKSFKARHQLNTHHLVHSNKRAFKCDICSNSFKIKSHLKFHMQTHIRK